MSPVILEVKMPLEALFRRVPQRWIVCALCSWAFAIVSYKNACFYSASSVVDSVSEKRERPAVDGCPFIFADSISEKRMLPFSLPDLLWDPTVTDISKKVFNMGRFWTYLPAGLLSDLGCSKYVLGLGMLLLVVGQLLTPVFVVSGSIGIFGYVIENLLEGISDGLIFPSVFSLISRWALPSERNTFTAVVVAGSYYGLIFGHVYFTVISMGISNWTTGQYTAGAVGLIWLVLGYIFIYHSPVQSPYLSQREFQVIVTNRRRSSLLLGRLDSHGVPWRGIFTSRPFLSLIFLYCSQEWIINLIINLNIVGYQKYIMHLPEWFTYRSNIAFGIASLPSILIGSFLADWIVKHELFSKKAVKRTFAFVSVFCSSVLVAILPGVGCNIRLFWVLSIVAVYILGLAASVIFSGPIDLCPRHAGLLMGIMLCGRTISFIFMKWLDKILSGMPDLYNPNYWQIKCFLFVLLAVSMSIFLSFFSGLQRSRTGNGLTSEFTLWNSNPSNWNLTMIRVSSK